MTTPAATPDGPAQRRPAVYTAEEFAALLGVSSWSLYQSVRRGDCPVPPIKVGRRLVWPRAAADRLLGIDGFEAADGSA